MRWCTILIKIMKLQNEIPNFLQTKLLSDNSKASYSYDLQQFCDFFTEREISESSILLFRKSLSSLSESAQKRKISAVNQFLRFLYSRKILKDFVQLPKADPKPNPAELSVLRDLNKFYGPIQSTGQFIALLILETGLTPSEIGQLKWSDFNWRFNTLELNLNGVRRVISLRNKFAVRAKLITNADELFSKTRQYLHSELKKYTELTARELREQYILRKVSEGMGIYELSELLGLKTIMTLGKYYKKVK
ncbi:site-specific tyrosine recombinase XerD [Lactovum odontotermitis]